MHGGGLMHAWRGNGDSHAPRENTTLETQKRTTETDLNFGGSSMHESIINVRLISYVRDVT